MSVEKPASVASDAYKSAKWDELTAWRDFDRFTHIRHARLANRAGPRMPTGL